MKASYGQAFVVTKSDTADIRPGLVSDALYVGGTGHLNVIMEDGQTVLISAVPAGTILPLRIKRLLDASTTATLVVALKH